MPPLNSNFFFNSSNFINTFYALNIAMEAHFSSFLLNDDVSRVVYSPTTHALRQRSKNSDWQDNFLPFMNYNMDDIEEGTDRMIWNSSGKLRGMWVPELSKYLRYAPVTINYDATVWYHQHLDNLFALTQIVWDDTSETIIDYTLMVNDINGEPKELKLFGILGYNFSYSPTFDRSDWLEQNKVHTNAINFNIQTYILQEGEDAWLPDEVVFNFARGKGLDPEEYDDTISIMHDYAGLRL